MTERSLPTLPEGPSVEECLKSLENWGVPPVNALAMYMRELLRWNSQINVTGAKTPDEFASKHIADVWLALQTMGHQKRPVVDVGSGCGIPGIPMAIINPGLNVALVERRVKKSMVLTQITKSLGLQDRIEVMDKAFELLKPLPENAEYWFRGFLPGPKLAQYLTQSFPTCDIPSMVLMKGPAWKEELQDLLKAPGVNEEWRQRFAESEEVHYDLPKNLGHRILALV